MPSTSTTSPSGIRCRPRVHRRGFCGRWFRLRSRWSRFRACRRRSRPSPARGAMFTPCTSSLLKTRLGDRRHPKLPSLREDCCLSGIRNHGCGAVPALWSALRVAELLSRRFDRGLPPLPEAVQRLALLLEEPNVELLVAHTDVAGELHHLPLDLGVVVAPGLLENVHVLARSVHNGHQRAPDLLGERLPELREIGVVRALCADV